MSIHALAIHPAIPDRSPPPTLGEFLRKIEFLGDGFDLYGTPCYRPGARFFDHIVFHRSHGVIELTPTAEGLVESEPRDSRQFCHIELDADEEVGFLCGCNIREPLCPACSATITAWSDMLTQWHNGDGPWSCPACGHSCAATDVNWQHLAGAARYWIKVDGVCEGEAIPSESFLDLLAAQTACDWRYFWYHL